MGREKNEVSSPRVSFRGVALAVLPNRGNDLLVFGFGIEANGTNTHAQNRIN